MKGVFVTATGTEVGKTLVACGIARWFKKRGLEPGVMKPSASGGRWTGLNGGRRLVSDDAVLLRKAAGSSDPIELINPSCYERPLAPYSASLLEKKKFPLGKVLESYAEIRRRHSLVIVEGVGGVRVPLGRRFEVADLLLKMRLPAVVVASAKLGTLNHTLLTWDYLKRRNAEVLGVVLNFFDRRNAADRTNLDFLRGKSIPVLAAIPESPRFRRDPDAVARELEKSPIAKNLRRLCL